MKREKSDEADRKSLIRKLMRERKKLIKKRKRMIKIAVNYITDFCSKELNSREEILSVLKEIEKTGFDIRYLLVESGEEICLHDIIDFVSSASEETVKEILRKVNEKLRKMDEAWEIAMQLEKRLNKDAPAGLETEIHSFSKLGRDLWGIKVTVGANTYLFWFEGTPDELAEVLLEERREQEKDIVKCPFCEESHLRAYAMKYLDRCSCGARIVCESARSGGWSPELEMLWNEGCSTLGIPVPLEWQKIHIDKFFENVKYVGRGTTNWRMWFVKEPWQLKKQKS
uniref:Uncharacterized protein n=1 Tax=Archaeoglobus fulgidus TaxID=2234 RepID=A0A7C2S444_ARCFL